MSLEALIKKAQQLEKEQQFDKAFECYSETIEKYPNQPDLYSWRGVVLFHLDRKQEALNDMDKAVELQPDYSYRYSSRAYIRASLKMTLEAIEDYKKCIELDPEDAVAYNNLGLLEEQLGWNNNAKKNFDKADELEGVLKDRGIISEKEQLIASRKSIEKNRSIENESNKSIGRIIRNVFTKKETFKEFLKFIKNGFKIKE